MYQVSASHTRQTESKCHAALIFILRPSSDEVLLKALLENKNISQALTSVGLTGSYNYNRCYKLLCGHMKGIGLPN